MTLAPTSRPGHPHTSQSGWNAIRRLLRMSSRRAGSSCNSPGPGELRYGAVMRSWGNAPELGLGLFLIALALFGFYATSGLSVGTAAEMGPGYVPRTLVGIILLSGVGYLAK